MKKAICYILGLVFSFFYGVAVVILYWECEDIIDRIIHFLFALFGFYPLDVTPILGILFTAILILILIKYYKTIKNSFNGSGLIMTFTVILGVILAVIGGFISIFYVFGFHNMVYIIIFSILVVSIKVGTRLAKSESSKITAEG